MIFKIISLGWLLLNFFKIRAKHESYSLLFLFTHLDAIEIYRFNSMGNHASAK